jgi:hypothetical protein
VVARGTNASSPRETHVELTAQKAQAVALAGDELAAAAAARTGLGASKVAE